MGLTPIQLSRPLIGPEEKAAVLEVLESEHLAQGSRVAALEASFSAELGAPHAVAVSSGTAGLFLALLAHGVGPGDEVITSPFSFVATANAILMVGATPVFADIEADSFNISPLAVRTAITPRTRALMPVHLYGRLAAVEELRQIAKEAGIVVVEDAAQAVGAHANGLRPGTGTTAVFSLYATKNVMAGEGGVVTTADPVLADRLRLLRNHGMRERYVYEGLGYNLRMTDLQAALGLVQMGRLPSLMSARKRNAAALSAGLQGVVTPEFLPGHAWHQYTVRVERDRDGMVARLAAAGIGSGVFYPLGLHQVPHVAALAPAAAVPATEVACAQVLSLPVHPQLSEADLDRIIEAVNAS